MPTTKREPKRKLTALERVLEVEMRNGFMAQLQAAAEKTGAELARDLLGDEQFRSNLRAVGHAMMRDLIARLAK